MTDMPKPTIFYFVHAHGSGHRATFDMLYPEMLQRFNVLPVTTNSNITKYLRERHGIDVIELPPKYPEGFDIPEHTFSKAFEVTPYAVEPARRAKYFAEMIERYRPVALYCDGVPELGIMARSMGVPVIMVHLPGNKTADPTQVFAYELADHIVAHFPQALEDPDFSYTSKTFYSGFISRYAGTNDIPKLSNIVSIVMGFDNYDETVVRNMTADIERQFVIIGNNRTYDLGANCTQLGRVSDVAKAIAGDIVISAAGQNSVAELISLNKRLILLPEPRPYDEQLVSATALQSRELAVLANRMWSSDEWKDAIEHATNMTPDYTGLVNDKAPKDITEKLYEWYG